MKIYYQDTIGLNDVWEGLKIQVSGNPKPDMVLHSGNYKKLRLSYLDNPIFWAKQDNSNYDVNILKNTNQWTYEEMPIPPITSQDIEAYKLSSAKEILPYWAKYFIEKIRLKNGLFLYDGLWKLYKPNTKTYIFRDTLHLNLFSHNLFDTIDWDSGSGYELITLKKLPDKNDGRVKWWRKKIQENVLPPILTWYISGLQSRIIVDGHTRLLACILENVKILPILEIASFYSNSSKNMQNNDMKSWNNFFANAQLSSQDINRVLLNEYVSKDEHIHTKSIFKPNFEKEWFREVQQRIDNPNLTFIDEICRLLASDDEENWVLAESLAMSQGWTKEVFRIYDSIVYGLKL